MKYAILLILLNAITTFASPRFHLLDDDEIRTIGLHSSFRGEDRYSNANKHPVIYLNENQRGIFKLEFKDGLILSADGSLYNTTDEEPAIFILDRNNDFYATTLHYSANFQHSSFTSGDSVRGAGEMLIKNGQLVSIKFRSTRYPLASLIRKPVLDKLTDHNIIVPSTEDSDSIFCRRLLDTTRNQQR